MKRIIELITTDTEMSATTQRMLSLCFLLLTCAIVFISFEEEGYLWDTKLTIVPDFISTILGILLISPLYARNILKWNKSIYTLITLFAFLLIFSSLVEIITGGDALKSSIIQILLVAAIALSWVGIKAVAGLAWILLFVAVAITIILNNYVMGVWGFLYIGSAFIGIVLHSGLNPSHVVKGFREEFRFSDEVKEIIISDINETNKVKEVIISDINEANKLKKITTSDTNETDKLNPSGNNNFS